MKCFMEQQKFFFDKAAFELREKLLAMPLKELPVQELEELGGFALEQADWAARLDTPDWQSPSEGQDRRRRPLDSGGPGDSLAGEPSQAAVLAPRSPLAASTRPSARQRRCSPWRGTWGNTRL